MKIALASVGIRNGDLSGNKEAVEKAVRAAGEEGAVLCCFGECVLQGFDCLTWDYEKDRDTGVSVDSETFRSLFALSRETGVDLLFGFIERDGEALFSSCALVSGDGLLHLYRRVSKGWKYFWIADGHYREGDTVSVFRYRGVTCSVALCGDLWDETAPRFRSDADLLFWPVYICYTPAEWEGGVLKEYAERAAGFCPRTLLINSVCRTDDAQGFDAYGGCAFFENGRVAASLPMGEEGILMVEI